MNERELRARVAYLEERLEMLSTPEQEILRKLATKMLAIVEKDDPTAQELDVVRKFAKEAGWNMSSAFTNPDNQLLEDAPFEVPAEEPQFGVKDYDDERQW